MTLCPDNARGEKCRCGERQIEADGYITVTGLSPMDRLWHDTKVAMAREQQAQEIKAKHEDLMRKAQAYEMHEQGAPRPGDGKPYGSPLNAFAPENPYGVPLHAFADDPSDYGPEEAAQEIADYYATQDPLMAGMGDGNGEPWVPEKFVEAPGIMEAVREAAQDLRDAGIDTGNLDAILEARGSRYGAFADNALVAQQIKHALILGKSIMQLDDDQMEALHQIAAKISRIVTGDPDYVDNWDDIAGYARLVAERLRG